MGRAGQYVAIIPIKTDSNPVLFKEFPIVLVGCGSYQAIDANPPGVFISSAHEFTSEDGGKDGVDAMIEEHRTQFDMISDRNIHVGFEEIILDLITMFEQKPAPGSVHREHTDLFSGRLDERGDFRGRKAPETLKGKHGLFHPRGKSRGV